MFCLGFYGNGSLVLQKVGRETPFTVAVRRHGQKKKKVLWFTHVVEPLSFSMFPLILSFDFDLILGSFFDFLGPLWAFFGFNVGFKKCFGSTHVVEHLSFSMISWILTFEFDFILGSFLFFWDPNGLVLWSY